MMDPSSSRSMQGAFVQYNEADPYSNGSMHVHVLRRIVYACAFHAGADSYSA